MKTTAIADDSRENEIEKLIQSYSLADKLEYVSDILEYLDITPYWEYTIVNGHHNTTDTVYHNLKHTSQVILNCYEGALYAALTRKETKTLLVAALFHDADHGCGAYSEKVNIAKAIDCFEEAQQALAAHESLSYDEALKVKELIGLTEYPYKKLSSSVAGNILRDADAMTVYTPDPAELKALFLGLYKEKVRQSILDEFTPSKFLQEQSKFALLKVWYTVWGKVKSFKKNYPECNKNIRHALELHFDTQIPK